jgi:Tol biopolymer transport system component
MLSMRFSRSVRRRPTTAILIALTAILITPSPEAVATFPGSNGDIAFQRRNHIWAFRHDGVEFKLAAGQEPAWSPDGSRIAFVRYPNARHGNIWTMAADGTDRVRVTSGQDWDSTPAWSPDGERLAFVSDRSGLQAYDIYTVAADPPFEKPVRVTRSAGNEFDVEWSPDGTQMAFGVSGCALGECGLNIGVVQTDGDGYRLLTSSEEKDVDPNWSPDSTTLLFASTRPASTGDTYNIFSIPATDGQVTQLTHGLSPVANREPIWSPDGTQFAYVHQSATYRVSIRAVHLDGSSNVRLCRGDPLFYPTTMDWQPI